MTGLFLTETRPDLTPHQLMNNSATGQLNFMTRFTCSDDIFMLGAPFSDQQRQLEPDSLIIIKVHTCHDLPSLLSSPIANYSLCASFLFAAQWQRPGQAERATRSQSSEIKENGKRLPFGSTTAICIECRVEGA